MPHRHRQRFKHRDLLPSHGDLVHAAGAPVAFAAEIDRVPANIDHFWITIRTSDTDSLRIALSTYSRQNAAAGFDPRMRIGLVASPWTELPEAGLLPSPGLDYRAIEAATPVTYVEYERPALEALLAENAGRSLFVEAWGELYIRTHLGLHQIHSRRASCSVLSDYIGRDGAIRFYFPDATAVMLLFKYCGQP